ncbi:Uncharacterized conserved protein, contains Zn finger domain [Streptomyces sp. LamerLS-31b]|uniref:SWIM zinc finger family protein n=1 Tax=Streptomyces sp. LamerLS-31b TaxID=1839765 RepID=UPI00081F6FEE|nr:SWIM zinc finger family protein [Streptomyces sp. LamerLS-31b]SCF59200.1 Uncharacterized conserved protein, contains Zn finger domain [Streptomyces sp. LamerLS-31b]
MTPTDPTRPADLAREALRAARRRSQALPGAERAASTGPATGTEGRQGTDAGFDEEGTYPRAESVVRGQGGPTGDGPAVEGSTGDAPVESGAVVEPGAHADLPAEPGLDAERPADSEGPDRVEGLGDTASPEGRTAEPTPRPGDAARAALRAAAAGGKRAGHQEERRGPEAGDPRPGREPHPGRDLSPRRDSGPDRQSDRARGPGGERDTGLGSGTGVDRGIGLGRGTGPDRGIGVAQGTGLSGGGSGSGGGRDSGSGVERGTGLGYDTGLDGGIGLGRGTGPGRGIGVNRGTGLGHDTGPDPGTSLGDDTAPGRDLTLAREADPGCGTQPGCDDPHPGGDPHPDRESHPDPDPEPKLRPDRDPRSGRVSDSRPDPVPSSDSGPRPAPEPASTSRPGDIAREALRAARREAEAAAEADRGGRRRPGRSAGAEARAQGMASSGRSGEHDPSRAARLKAAGEMRQFLKTAFRMPPEADAEPADDPAPTLPEHEHEHEHEHRPEPAVPHAPPTMATPHRDGEHRRTFPAFAPRGERAEDGAFAGTWWGNAWVQALERGALDAKRVARGRGYADQGHVDAITVTPGSVLAYVRGSRPRPYRVQVRVRPLADAEWERFLDTAVDRPGHIAALLDKELPHSLADCGVPLLPGLGDLAPRCSCPDSGHPCKHAAALCYQTARLLDADPFVLLLLRGRGERELLDALSRRSAARAARDGRDREPSSLPGIRAIEALAPRTRPPLPPPAPLPAHPEQPPAYPAAPGGPDPFALDQLATDAAARAHALLGTGRDPVGELSLWQDAVRLAAARPGSGLTVTTRALYATLAGATDRTPGDLARAVAAWRQGGVEGLAVLEEPWDPPAGRFDRARPLLLAADLPAFRPWRNRLTHPLGQVQLRLGRDGLWYVYESEPGEEDWWPRGTPDLDPVGALTGLGTPDGT